MDPLDDNASGFCVLMNNGAYQYLPKTLGAGHSTKIQLRTPLTSKMKVRTLLYREST